jgi:multicomponent Na+:H+ antiporter subunit F
MTDFYLVVATFILAMIALGLLRVIRGPNSADRMMAAQLLGSGGVAILLLSAIATGSYAVVDVALLIALLAAFAVVAFVRDAPTPAADVTEETSRP